MNFWSTCPEFHWIRYFDLVERWALLVGPTAVHVRVLEQGRVDDPVADLCSLIGIDRDVVAAGPPADGPLGRVKAVMDEKKNADIGLNAFVKLDLAYRILGNRTANSRLRSRLKNPLICMTNIGIFDWA